MSRVVYKVTCPYCNEEFASPTYHITWGKIYRHIRRMHCTYYISKFVDKNIKDWVEEIEVDEK